MKAKSLKKKSKLSNGLLTIYIPKIFQDALHYKQFKGLYGGRGSGKSYFCALYCIIKALESKKRICCLRTIDNKNDESGLALIKEYVESLGISHLVEVKKGDRKIIFFNGSEIMFFGANDSNHENFKSTENIAICWLDEAALFSMNIIRTIVPTIRREGAEVIFSWNPSKELDPCNEFLNEQASQGDRVMMIKANYYDNPFASQILIDQAEADKANNYERYLHIWEGHPALLSQQLIYSQIVKEVEFESPHPSEVNYMIGVDWGYTNYSAAVRAFIQNDVLHIDHESYRLNLGVNDLDAFFQLIPYNKTIPMIADCNNPLMINEAKIRGYFIKPCQKNTNDVQGVVDGIEAIRNLKGIHIHPRCQNLLREMRAYRWQKKGDTILLKPVKQDDHGVDALRYACEQFIIKKIRDNNNLVIHFR